MRALRNRQARSRAFLAERLLRMLSGWRRISSVPSHLTDLRASTVAHHSDRALGFLSRAKQIGATRGDDEDLLAAPSVRSDGFDRERLGCLPLIGEGDPPRLAAEGRGALGGQHERGRHHHHCGGDHAQATPTHARRLSPDVRGGAVSDRRISYPLRMLGEYGTPEPRQGLERGALSVEGRLKRLDVLRAPGPLPQRRARATVGGEEAEICAAAIWSSGRQGANGETDL
jgi:hypothetical protein